jgi:hypothetical protein
MAAGEDDGWGRAEPARTDRRHRSAAKSRSRIREQETEGRRASCGKRWAGEEGGPGGCRLGGGRPGRRRAAGDLTGGAARNPRRWESSNAGRARALGGRASGVRLGTVRFDPLLCYPLARGGNACNFLQRICLHWKTIRGLYAKLREARPRVLRSPSATAALALEKASDEAGCLFRLSSFCFWKAGKS